MSNLETLWLVYEAVCGPDEMEADLFGEVLPVMGLYRQNISFIKNLLFSKSMSKIFIPSVNTIL